MHHRTILILFLFSFGVFAQSVYFDGDDYAEETVANYRASDERGTIAVWFRYTSSLTADAHLFGSSDEAATNQHVGFIIDKDGSGFFHISARVRTPTSNNIIDGATSLDAIVYDSVYFAVLMSTGSNYKLYLNGSEDTPYDTLAGADNGNWFADIATQRDNITLGCLHTSGGYVSIFDGGFIDEVAVFSDTLTPAKVTEYYNSGTCQPDLTGEADLVGYWRMNEGSGTTITDAAGSVVFDFAASTNDPSWETSADSLAAGCTTDKQFKQFSNFPVFKK